MNTENLDFDVYDVVYDIRFGTGEVTSLNKEAGLMEVTFKDFQYKGNNLVREYTTYGKTPGANERVALLRKNVYKLHHTGDLPEELPQKDQVVYVWDNDEDSVQVKRFSHIDNEGKFACYFGKKSSIETHLVQKFKFLSVKNPFLPEFVEKE